jgi:allophanate hydrolase
MTAELWRAIEEASGNYNQLCSLLLQRAQLARIGHHRAWLSVATDTSIEQQLRLAWERRAGGEALPLFGLLFAVKDNLDVAGLPTTAACPSFAYSPEEDAFAVALLRRAGAVVLGKTNMDQFATGLVGTRSPHGAVASAVAPGMIAGGSSSGSAVAVALGHVAFALGTDTAGSGRVPAAFNELVGLKPTRGLVSTRGLVPACRTLDCVTVFSQQLEAGAKVLAAMSQFDPLDPYSRCAPPVVPSPSEHRLGVLAAQQLECFGDSAAAQVYAAALARAATCADSTSTFDFGPFRQAAQLLYEGAWVAERYAAVGAFLEVERPDLDPTVRGIIRRGKSLTAVEAFRNLYTLESLRRQVDQLWQHVDLLALPTTPTTYSLQEVAADPLGTNSRLGYYTNFVNLLDLAAIAVPAGRRSDGAALGLTLLGPAFSEQRLAAFANKYLAAASPPGVAGT